MRVAFAGGGTGGHIVPGLHLVERARLLTSGGPHLSDLLWFSSGRAIEDRMLANLDAPCDYERVILELEPPGGGAPTLSRIACRTPSAFLVARQALRAHRTEVLLGLGGFTSWPAALAARSLGLPVAILEINAAPGKVTKLVGPWVQRVFHAWRATLPAARAEGRHILVGAPVSPDYRAFSEGTLDPQRSRRELGFDPDLPLLLVLGGSQGAGSLNAFMKAHAALLLERGIQILHQCGPGRRSEAPADQPASVPGVGPALRVEEFIAPVWPSLAAATLVLCRGGASTLAEVAAARRPACVVPYPHHADRHQARNAAELGAGVRIVADDALDPSFVDELAYLCGPAGAKERAAMSNALASAAPQDAALQVLIELEKLIARRAS